MPVLISFVGKNYIKIFNKQYKDVPPRILIKGLLKIKCSITTATPPNHGFIFSIVLNSIGRDIRTRDIITAPGIYFETNFNFLDGSLFLKIINGRNLVICVAKTIIKIASIVLIVLPLLRA